jgi:hypothetical protein
MGIKVWKTLGEVDGAVLKGQARHFGEDGEADFGQFGSDGHGCAKSSGCIKVAAGAAGPSGIKGPRN